MNPTDRRAAFMIIAVLLLAGLLVSPLSMLWRVLVGEALATALLLYVLRRCKSSLPFGRSPTYRLLAVGALLLAIVSVVSWVVPTPGSLGLTLYTDAIHERLAAGVIGVLAIPSAIFGELFFRGVLYSVLNQWRGGLAAILGTAAISVVLALPLLGLHWSLLGVGFGISVILGASRWHTGSITPAVLAQGTHAIPGALFAVLVAVS